MSALPEIQPRWRARAAHPKLDLRLTALLELDGAALTPKGDPTLQREASTRVLRRSGSLAFLRGRLDQGAGREASGGTLVPVFITTRSTGTLDRLTIAGMSLRSTAGPIATAEVPLSAIRLLEDDPEVVAIEWTGGAAPLATTDEGAVALLTPPQGTPVDGRGVLIGIVDVEGLDIYHPDFVREDGTSRVAHLWDQSAPAPRDTAGGRVPAPWGYGVEYTRSDLAIELDPNRRRRHAWVAHEALKGSHGTMVAGVAAGRGAEDARARGVAPGADLTFVNTFASRDGALAAMTEIAEAIEYVFRRAEDRPCVVNVSLGDELGPHDGSSPVERFIDELLTVPGRAVVIAAGNSGQARRHMSGRLDASTTSTELLFDVGSSVTENLVIEVWYDAGPSAALDLTAEVEAPRGLARTSRVVADGRPQVFEIEGTRVLAAGTRAYPGSENGLVRIELFAGRAGGSLVEGRWALRLFTTGEGPLEWHAWIAHRYARWSSGSASSNAGTVTSPGTSRGALTVGACSEASREVCWFSGRGPGRRGVDKPDLVAVGTGLTVAAAAMTERYLPRATGTSFAAPQVAGAAALLFQRWGKIPASEVKQRLLADAEGGGAPGPEREPKWMRAAGR